MNKKDITSSFNNIVNHEFTKEVFQDSVPVVKDISVPGTITKVAAQYKRDLDINETYLLNVGNRLSHLLIMCEQLRHIPYYLLSFCPTKTMKDVGVNRHNHILLFIEDYIVRTQSLYDRTLQLVNVVFNIYDSPNLIGHNLVITNAHVRNSKLPPVIKKLKKITDKYYKDRLNIIHKECYQDDDLRYLELLSIVSSTKDDQNIKEDLKFYSRDYVNKKAKEFLCLNKEIYSTLFQIFDVLKDRYEEQKLEYRILYKAKSTLPSKA